MQKLKLTKCWKTLMLLICGSLLSAGLYAQSTIKGTVTDDKGEPLAGATVRPKSTPVGAVTTDVNGKFSIKLANGENAIQVVYLGYVTKEVAVTSKTANLTIALVSSSQDLNEVVVVGYGTQKKRDVTGSVASVNAATLQEAPASNLIAELKGRTAGVDIQSNSSTPGGAGAIRIRGDRTLTTPGTNTDGLDGPLIVLDGIPFGGSINDIDPDNVASLEILKDASAEAIYGSRGSGGVILITTLRGKTGKATISYNAYYGISSVLGELHVLSGTEYAQLKADAAALNTQSPGAQPYPLTAAEQAGLAAGTNTDWQKLIYQKGNTSDQSINLSGGDEKTQYGMGVGYYTETGIIPNQRFERYSIRTTLDHKLNDHIKVGINSLNVLSYNNTPGGGGVTGGLLGLSPLVSPYNPDGSVNLYPEAGSIDASKISPLTLTTDATAIYNNTRRLRTFNSMYGQVNFLKDFTYRINVGVDYTQTQSGNYTGPLTYVNSGITTPALSTASITNGDSYTYTLENLLTYDKTFAKKNHITFTGLFSAQKDHNQSSGFNAQGVPADYFQNTNLALAASVSPQQGAWSERGLISYMGRVNYSYDSRYLITATLRTDAASVLAPGHQYLSYPALALGWNVTNESFMKRFETVDNLKVRASYGKTGNQGTGPYQTLGLLGSGPSYTYNFGTTTAGQQNGYLVTSLANNLLSWQSTAEYDAGIDFGLFKDRITGTIDVYNQQTKDILANNIIPPSTGATTQTANLASTKDYGLEIGISTVNVRLKSGFTWTTDVNFAMSREAITALPNGATSNIANGWFVGQPLTVIYDYKKIGIWQTGDPALALQTSPTEVAGQIRVQDLNGDNKIDPNDKQVIGNFQPQWTGGMTNTFKYKNFDFSIVMFARMGQTIAAPYISTDAASNGFGFFLQGRSNELKVDYWTPTNPTNAFPRPDASVSGPIYGSTLQYVDGSFIKCRSMNLGYTVPSKLLSKAGITGLRVYITALNPFILYSPFVKAGYGPDPEGNGTGGVVTSTSNNGPTVPGQVITVNANNPSTRAFNFGVNLKF